MVISLSSKEISGIFQYGACQSKWPHRSIACHDHDLTIAKTKLQNLFFRYGKIRTIGVVILSIDLVDTRILVKIWNVCYHYRFSLNTHHILSKLCHPRCPRICRPVRTWNPSAEINICLPIIIQQNCRIKQPCNLTAGRRLSRDQWPFERILKRSCRTIRLQDRYPVSIVCKI